jgi:hypothetical protein
MREGGEHTGLALRAGTLIAFAVAVVEEQVPPLFAVGGEPGFGRDEEDVSGRTTSPILEPMHSH